MKTLKMIIINKLCCIIMIASTLILLGEAGNSNDRKDFNRKSIVFDIKTPKVFYCPQEKQSDFSKTIVKAKPLDKLCEFGGKTKPKGSTSDCYNDVDETEFACDEKKRFLMRLDTLADESGGSMNTMEQPEYSFDDLEFVLNKGLASKKKSNYLINKKLSS